MVKIPLINVIICKNCFGLIGYFWNPNDEWIFLHKELKEYNLVKCEDCHSYSNKDSLGKKISLYFKFKMEVIDLVLKVKQDGKIPKDLQEKIKNIMVVDNL